ncbi:hypothetical protein MMC29_002355 [Sticta canariensis]|nr:hypothetical protein [Sticta canariensis]
MGSKDRQKRRRLLPKLAIRIRRNVTDEKAQSPLPSLPADVSSPSQVSQAPRPASSRHKVLSQGLPSQASISGFTREQLDAKFALEQRKAEAEVAAIEAKTRREDEESRARTAAIQSAAVVAVPRTQVDEEEPIDEISPAALLVAGHYPGLPMAEISRTFSNKFRPENLYKLRQV